MVASSVFEGSKLMDKETGEKPGTQTRSEVKKMENFKEEVVTKPCAMGDPEEGDSGHVV